MQTPIKIKESNIFLSPAASSTSSIIEINNNNQEQYQNRQEEDDDDESSKKKKVTFFNHIKYFFCTRLFLVAKSFCINNNTSTTSNNSSLEQESQNNNTATIQHHHQNNNNNNNLVTSLFLSFIANSYNPFSFHPTATCNFCLLPSLTTSTPSLSKMPALYLFGRRWLSGTDDFLITGFFFAMWNTICTCLVWIPYFPGDCPQGLALPLGAITVAGAAIFALLTFFTLRGRILEPSTRKNPVTTLLYLATAQNIALLICGTYAVVDFFKDNFPASCSHREAVSLKVASIKTLMLPILFFLINCLIRWDPYGGLSENQLRTDTTLYHDTWVKRVRKIFCCHASEDNSEYFDHIAAVMSFLFQGHDLVPTDILAGMTLLGSHQKRVMQKRADDLVKYDLSRIHLGSSTAASSEEIKVSHQAVPLHTLTEEDKKIIDEVAHFAKYFMAAYGWALYVFRDLKCGFCKLCTRDCGTCCRSRPYLTVGDNCCMYNNVAMQATAQLQDDDIIMSSFENEMMLPTFFVAIDRPTNTVVITIRGTMSLEDTMVDLVATPVKMHIADLAGPKNNNNNLDDDGLPRPVDYSSSFSSSTTNNNNNNNTSSKTLGNDHFNDLTCMAHSGILKAAANVFDRLDKQGIFKSLVEEGGAHFDKKVKVIGHSLGGGCATMLTLLMRERFPAQLREPRLTCFAVSPPGGLLSRDLAEYTRKFIVSPFVGLDIIPRLSMHNMINMRDAMFECLSASEHNKNIVVLHSACPCSCCQGTLLPNPDEVGELPPEVANRVTILLNGNSSAAVVADARDEKIKDRSEKITASKSSAAPLQEPLNRNAAVAMGDSSTASLASGQQQQQQQDHKNNNNNNFGVAIKMDQHSPYDRESSQINFTTKLYPPGRLLMYANVASTSTCCSCGSYCCGTSGTDGLCATKIHLPIWVTLDDLQEIVVCPAMGLDHLPDRCQNVFENTRLLIRNGNQDVSGFFSQDLTADAAEKERRMWQPTWFCSPVVHTAKDGTRQPHHYFGGDEVNNTHNNNNRKEGDAEEKQPITAATSKGYGATQ